VCVCVCLCVYVSCLPAHIYTYGCVEQLIGGGMNGFDESGLLGMWPWLSSCSLGAAADNKPEFLSVSDQGEEASKEEKKTQKNVMIICSFNNQTPSVNSFQSRE